jgi:hypothetical protein
MNKEKQAAEREKEKRADGVIAQLQRGHRLQAVKANVGRGLKLVKEYLLCIEASIFGEVQRKEDELKTGNEEIQRRIKYALDSL